MVDKMNVSDNHTQTPTYKGKTLTFEWHRSYKCVCVEKLTAASASCFFLAILEAELSLCFSKSLLNKNKKR